MLALPQATAWLQAYRIREDVSHSIFGSTGVETIQAFASAFAAEVALMSLPEDLADAVVDVFAAYGCDLTQVTSDPSWIHDGPLVTNHALLSSSRPRPRHPFGRGVAYETCRMSHLPDAPQDVFKLIGDLIGVLFKRLKSLELEPSIPMSPHDLALRRSAANTSAFFGLAVDLRRLQSDSLSKIHRSDETFRQLEALKTPAEVHGFRSLTLARTNSYAVRSPIESASRIPNLSTAPASSTFRPTRRLVSFLPMDLAWAMFVEPTGLRLTM